jgi:diguanylate cyclase (GGDEF)-like protein
MNQELERRANHDALTGLPNRRLLMDRMEQSLARCDRDERCAVLFMIDVDHFKQVNDTYGHLAGDAVLRTISERIRKSVRGSELIGRYGGEEFLIVLPGSDEVQVGEIAERVRQAIAEEPVRIDQGFLAVTVSIGTAIIEPLSDTEKDALATADNALYESKNLGRNRVTVALTGGRARARDLQAGLSR